MSSLQMTMNELQQGVQGWLKCMLGASVMAASAIAFAATPLNDHELDVNFVTSQLPSDPTGAVFKQIVTLSDVKPSPLALSPVDDLSALVSIMEEQQSKLMLSLNNPYMATNSFGEMASYGFGSEFYSYRWAKNFEKIYTPSEYQYFYFNSLSGYMEVDPNIHGHVEIEATIRPSNPIPPFYHFGYIYN